MSTSLPLPRYHQIYLVLREQLAEGRFPQATPIPGEIDLARRFGVSRVTMRAALDRLVAEGLISRQRGKGTFVRVRDPIAAGAPARGNPSGLLDNILSMGLKTSVKLIDVAIIAAPSDVAELLGLPPAAPVQKAVRVRRYRNAPLSHITTFVPADLAVHLGRRELTVKPMLSLLEASGVAVSSADQTISAKLADHAVAPLLGVEIGAPLLAVTRLVYDDDGRPVQLLRGLYRPDRYEYRMHLTRSGADTPRIWISNEGADRSARNGASGRGTPRPRRNRAPA